MSTTAVFLALLAGVIVWILVVRRLTARSWESRGPAAVVGDVAEIGLPPAKLHIPPLAAHALLPRVALLVGPVLIRR